MKYVYPAIFTPVGGGEYDVKVFDLPGCRSCGKGLADAIYMAEDAAAMWLWDAENHSEKIPEASDLPKVEMPQIASYIAVDTDEYRRKYDSRAVKKTLTIPAWLNTAAERENVNFSQVLQSALKETLGLDDQPRA